MHIHIRYVGLCVQRYSMFSTFQTRSLRFFRYFACKGRGRAKKKIHRAPPIMLLMMNTMHLCTLIVYFAITKSSGAIAVVVIASVALRSLWLSHSQLIKMFSPVTSPAHALRLQSLCTKFINVCYACTGPM